MHATHLSQGVRIERLAPAEEPHRAQWLHALRGFDAATATALKTEGTNVVWRATMLGRQVVIKTQIHTSLLSRLKLALRASRACRHWEGAAWLTDHGFKTAPVLLLAAEYLPGGTVEWLVMDYLPGRSLLETMAAHNLTAVQDRALARAVGRQAAAMVLAGAFNRDHKPSNLILTDQGPAVIDCVAIKPCPVRKHRALERMLASLVIEPTGLNCRPRRSLLMQALTGAADTMLGKSGQRPDRRALVHHLWRRVASAVELHGNPTPRVNPRTPD